MGRKGVHTTHTHTVQTAADLVGAFVELTSGMEHCHHHLKCRLVQFGMFVHGNSSTVVLHGDRVVGIDGHFNVRTVARHCLVDRVVNGFVYQMVQTFFADVSDIHCGAFAYGLQSLEHLDVTR